MTNKSGTLPLKKYKWNIYKIFKSSKTTPIKKKSQVTLMYKQRIYI